MLDDKLTLALLGEDQKLTMTDGRQALDWLVANNFMGRNQSAAVRQGMYGEEKDYFIKRMVELKALILSMPSTGQQDSDDGMKSTAYLHYFAGGQANLYVTEKDKGAEDDTPEMAQSQAFGLADLFGDGGELGYASIKEWLENKAELDLHFTPKTLGEIRERNE